MVSKNTVCLWYNGTALEAAQFYAATFPDSRVDAVHHAPGDYPAGKAGDVLTVEFTLMGIFSNYDRLSKMAISARKITNLHWSDHKIHLPSLRKIDNVKLTILSKGYFEH